MREKVTGNVGIVDARMPISSREMDSITGMRETGYGHLHALPIPMVECQRCHHDVICRFALLEKYERLRARFAARCTLKPRPGAKSASHPRAMEWAPGTVEAILTYQKFAPNVVLMKRDSPMVDGESDSG